MIKYYFPILYLTELIVKVTVKGSLRTYKRDYLLQLSGMEGMCLLSQQSVNKGLSSFLFKKIHMKRTSCCNKPSVYVRKDMEYIQVGCLQGQLDLPAHGGSGIMKLRTSKSTGKGARHEGR